MISIRTHNVLDYLIGAALILTPHAFGFAGIHLARDAFTLLGGALIGYSLLTDYAYSAIKAIPLSVHMTFDLVSGAFIMLAPSIYSYRAELGILQYAMHFILGLGMITLVVFTQRGAEPPAVRRFEDETEGRPIGRAA